MISKKAIRFLVGISLVLFISTTVFAQGKESAYKIFRPKGPGPHPAVVFMSGCSGFTPGFAPEHYNLVAEKLRSKGYVVVFADYLDHRGKMSCMEVTTAEAAEDLVAAAAWLKSQPYIDPARITAIGWSFGGNAILVAINNYKTDQLVFSRAIVYYPSCGGLWKWKAKVPVLMLLAGEDRVARSDMCQDAAKESANTDMVKMVIYPDAQHCFDMSELPPEMYYEFGKIGYDPQAAAAAWREVERFLR
jgi:dienelactone hydrolase